MLLRPGTYLKGKEYEIIKTLGQGGFGITYEARQINLDRIVAIKEFFMKDCCERDGETSSVSVPTQSNRDLVDRFKGKFIREAKMIASFDNQHIVRVTDVFEENGTAYYVMDMLPGGSLTDLVKTEGPLSEATAERYIRQVADALAYIHSLNTVHLDVKPSNILLNPKGEAVVIDFGISKHYDESGQQTSSTPVGISKGYAPLEQSRDGDVSQFKPSTDIYALGATLYYLVTGTVPPEASVVNEDGLERPGGLSDRIWRAIESAMRPRRKDRPQKIGDFLRLLDDPAEARVAGNHSSVEGEETVITGSGSKESCDIKPDVPSNQPKLSEAEESGPASPAASKSAPATPERKPFRKGLWIAVASGIAALALVLLLLPRHRPEPGAPLAQTNTSASSAGSSDLSSPEEFNGHECVDLGLSVKWATCNVGASSPSDYGDYYAWGETSTKSDYSWANYKYRVSGAYKNVTFSKYNTKAERGTIDNKKSLDLSDDAAHSNWGGKWRMPTDAEWTELLEKCKWTWTSQGGKNGYKVTGPNENSIFLPAAGRRDDTDLYFVGSNGFYWSSSLGTDYPDYAWNVDFSSGGVGRLSVSRFFGLSVRPVSE